MQVAPKPASSLSGNASAPPLAPNQCSSKRKGTTHDSGSAGHGAAGKRTKALPSSNGKAAAEPSQQAAQLSPSQQAHDDVAVADILLALQAGTGEAQPCSAGFSGFGRNSARLAMPESAGSGAAASGSANEPSSHLQEGSGLGGEAASLNKRRLIRPEGAGINSDNTLQPRGSTVQHEAEQPQVGAQQHSFEPLDGAQEDRTYLRGPPPASLPAGLHPGKDAAPSASADICMQAQPRNAPLQLESQHRLAVTAQSNTPDTPRHSAGQQLSLFQHPAANEVKLGAAEEARMQPRMPTAVQIAEATRPRQHLQKELLMQQARLRALEESVTKQQANGR